MHVFGLIGKKLGHSFSKKFFTEKFAKNEIVDAKYDLFELDSIDEIHSLLDINPAIKGLNVTIPYKQAVIPLLSELNEFAFETGAVNCIKVVVGNGQRRLLGYNTDVYGFKESLQNLIKDKDVKQALILGNGGSAKAVKFVLNQLNVPFFSAVRAIKDENELLFDELTNAHYKTVTLIINTTPLGMYPHENAFPAIDYNEISEQHIVFDLIYNPAQTEFMKKCAEKGAEVKNGLEMLYLQAEKSWEIWNRKTI